MTTNPSGTGSQPPRPPQPARSYDLTFQSVRKAFTRNGRAVEALRDVTFTCREREVTTVVGASGCGKTTLLNIAAGLIRPDAGMATVGGLPVTAPGPDRGVVFQHYALFPWLTVRENVAFPLKYQRLSKSERVDAVDRYLELVGLANFSASLPKELSGGMKQRCALARALVARPKVLLMDEPFGALDALTRERLQDEMVAIVEEEQVTVFFITHDVDEAVYLSGRVVVINDQTKGVQDIVEVPLAWPRVPTTRITNDFTILRNRVWELLHSNEQRGTSCANQSPRRPRRSQEREL
jgi:NitT/TauT family transport system ATP-binding protein